MLSDEDLIREIAYIWVDNGGDAEGIYWVVDRLANAIQEEIDSRNESNAQ